MAKVISTLELQGTYDGITYVKSPSYGNHIRAKRGTHKKAVLNAGWQKQKEKLVRSNVPARILKNAIDPYRQDFYDGKLWPRIVSMTNDQDLDGGQFDFSKLQPFDFYRAYPLSRLLIVETKTTVEGEGAELQVKLTYNMHPRFEESLHLDGYRFGVVAIFPDQENKSAKTAAVYSDVIADTAELVPLEMRIPVPPAAKVFLICVRLDGYQKGKPYSTRSSIGMAMTETGRLGQSLLSVVDM